jgi:uncharacterized damage-inducible protein DinB
MFHSISEFLTAWKIESDSTLKLFRALTDQSLAQRVTPDGRTLGFIAWHIIGSLTYTLGELGLPIAAPTEKDPLPASAAAIAVAFEKCAQAVAQTIHSNWTDDQLPGYISIYGETWTRSFLLASLLAHSCHHRGQMTVLMRQAGLKVPGIYGPSKEEWANFAMEPQP